MSFYFCLQLYILFNVAFCAFQLGKIKALKKVFKETMVIEIIMKLLITKKLCRVKETKDVLDLLWLDPKDEGKVDGVTRIRHTKDHFEVFTMESEGGSRVAESNDGTLRPH